MEQEKNKVPSQENENPGLEKFQRAQELYERYFISNEEADFEEMITVLDSIYKNRVKSELREKGCCDKENYEDAMQEARQGIWTRIKKQRETGELHKEFSQYCGGIYTYKAVDIAKKKNSYEQKMREVKKKGKKEKKIKKVIWKWFILMRIYRTVMEHMVSWQQIQTRKTEQNQKFLQRNQEIFLGYICRSIVRQ